MAETDEKDGGAATPASRGAGGVSGAAGGAGAASGAAGEEEEELRAEEESAQAMEAEVPHSTGYEEPGQEPPPDSGAGRPS